MSRRLLVLAWHSIERTWCMPGADDGATAFASQVRALRRVATVVPLDAALDTLAVGDRLPPHAVALTFDDGYRDNVLAALPVLRAAGLPATFYLVPGFLSGDVHAWWERLGWAVRNARAPLGGDEDRTTTLRRLEIELKAHDHVTRCARVERIVEQADPGRPFGDGLFADWDEARELVRAGMSVGSHTMAHAILAREREGDQVDDLARSRRLLGDRLATDVRSLAYPNGEVGDYDATTVAAARGAGYARAVTTWGRTVEAGHPPFEVRRKVVSTAIPAATFAAIVLRNLHAHRLPTRLPGR